MTCDQYCPAPGGELSGTWSVAPYVGDLAVVVWDCRTDNTSTEAAPGAGGDEAAEGLECAESNISITPYDINYAAPYHFSVTSTSEDLELTVGAYSQSPDYTLEGQFYLDSCIRDGDIEWCALTLFHMVLETTSSMAFGGTTVVESKAFLAQSVTTDVNMSTGEFSFAVADSVIMGVSWEEQGTPNVENSTNITNDSDVISGVLDLDSTPTITFDGTLSPTGGSLDIMDVEATIDNQGPDADESNTEQVIDCVPTIGHPHETWAILDASASTDFDDNISAYLWYVDDEFVDDGETAGVYVGVGIHDVKLLVSDEFGAYSAASFTLDVDDPVGACD